MRNKKTYIEGENQWQSPRTGDALNFRQQTGFLCDPGSCVGYAS